MEEQFDFNWIQQPLIFEKNSLSPHSDHELIDCNRITLQHFSLDGKWEFKYYKCLDEVNIGLIKKENYNLLEDSILVPGHLQLQGYGKPQYVNTQYPWDGIEAIKPPYVPEKNNPVGVYGKKFDLPKDLHHKRVRIVFEGIESCFYLWLNGKFIGYHEDSFCPAEFDLTENIKPTNNYICVMVVQFCSGSWLEDQDFFRFSGIFRSVGIYGIEKVHIEDLKVKTELQDDFKMGIVNIDVTLDCDLYLEENLEEKYLIKCKICNQNQEQIYETTKVQTINKVKESLTFSQPIDSPRLWSAEMPNLYICEVMLFNLDTKAYISGGKTFFGFRKFEIHNKVMYLNGKRIVFRGVNRHEFHLDKGRAINKEDIEADIILMKKNNINAVRTSHYPNQKVFYQLCDQYGLYVIDETNLETHGTWQKIGKVVETTCESLVPGDHMIWEPSVLARGKAMFERDKNHPCILMWSCGNESFGGVVIRNLANWFRSEDTTRLVHYEGVFRDRRYDETSDIESRMYAKPEEIIEYLENNPSKPLILCEYSHAMGNSFGGVDRYIALETQYEMYQGGFIWDFCDQALKNKSVEGIEYAATGGAFDDYPNDGYFCGNGLCFADHTPSPKMEEAKYLYQPIKVEFENNQMIIKNNHLFLNIDEYEFRWKLLVDGVEQLRNRIAISIAPGEEGRIDLPINQEVLAQFEGELIFECSYHLKEDRDWANAGYEIGFGQYIIKKDHRLLKEENSRVAELIEGDFNVGIQMKNAFALFSKANGKLISIKKDDKELLVSPINPDFWRAPIDNDEGNDNTFRWAQWKLASLYQKCIDIQVSKEAGSIISRFKLATNPTTYCTLEYQCFYDDFIKVTMNLEAFEGDLPCIGISLQMKKTFEDLEWYGNSQTESYQDRKNGCRIELKKDKVENQYIPYLNPQENANKVELRRFAIMDAKREGLQFISHKVFEASALPYTSHEIENACNIVSLPRSQSNVVGLYGKKSGVGGDDSWGAPVVDEYLVDARKDTTFSICMKII